MEISEIAMENSQCGGEGGKSGGWGAIFFVRDIKICEKIHEQWQIIYVRQQEEPIH